MNREIPLLSPKELRKFSWIFASLVAGLFGLIFPWILNRDLPMLPWIIAVFFFVWGLLIPKTLQPFYRLWMRFGFLMNAIMTRLVLGIVFYLVILPFGLIFRVRGKDLINRKWDKASHSYRVSSSKAADNDMERPF